MVQASVKFKVLKSNSKRSKILGKRVLSGLRRHNKKFMEIVDSVPLNVEVKNSLGKVVAGLTGETSYGWLTIWILWTHEKFRGQGIGKKVMAIAEREAKHRGCKRSILWTMDFQAPNFYRKLGYRTHRTLKNYTHGFDSLTMVKVL